jgi:hypothetical protein
MWSVVRPASLAVALALASCGGTSSPDPGPQDLSPDGTALPLVDGAGVPLFLQTAWYLPLEADSALVYDYSADAGAPDHTVAVTTWRRVEGVWQAEPAERFPYTADRAGAEIDRPSEPERWSFVANTDTALHVTTSTAGTAVLFNCDSGAWPITVRMVTHGCSGF